MKKCPFCAEEIQDKAIKCKHCGEWLNKDVPASPKVLEAGKIKPSVAQPQGELVSPESDEEIKRKKEAGFTQCPTCGKWDVYLAIVEDGGEGNWCPHCKKSIQLKRITPATEIDKANKMIDTAAISGVIAGVLTIILSAMGTIHIWSGIIESIIAFLLSYGIYKKSRVCSITLFSLFLVNKIGQIVDRELKSVALIMGIIFLYYFFQGIRGTFAYHKILTKERKQTTEV